MMTRKRPPTEAALFPYELSQSSMLALLSRVPERKALYFCSIVQRAQTRRAMIANRLMILGAVLAFSANSVYAGPCNTVSRDAGSGNVPGYTGQTTGSTATDSKQHPPASSMSKVSENTATSSEDAQRQMQSQPTAAEQLKATHPAPSAQSPDRTAGTVEQTRPAPTEKSKKARAGAAESATSEQKVTAAERDCE